MAYILEIKQIIDYPRVRIHRELIQRLLADQALGGRGDCRLFSFMVLCSFANFRSSRMRIDGVSHLIGPGEWICDLREMAGWFGFRRMYQAVEVLEELSEAGFIRFHFLHESRLVRYQIHNWGKFNTVLEYECRCQKDSGFFFFPICFGQQLMKGKRCSERDILIDLWLHAIYKDGRVKGSELGPVVYLRNGRGDPLTSCSKLAQRWGRSKATASRILTKLEALGYIQALTFSGRHGTVIYLENYLSIMFQIADLPINRSDVAMKLRLKTGDIIRTSSVCCVSDEENSVSKSTLQYLLSKLLQILSAQGFSCCSCKKKSVKLYPLSSACAEWKLEVRCNRQPFRSSACYSFVIRITYDSG